MPGQSSLENVLFVIKFGKDLFHICFVWVMCVKVGEGEWTVDV